jgi:hypothetical protein
MYQFSASGPRRYLVNNLVIPSIAAVTTTEVTVTVSNGGLPSGGGGFAVPRVALSGGLAILPIRVVSATTFVIPFCNASAGAIDNADTVEFDCYIFEPGGVAQSV